MYCKVTTQQS